MAETQTALRNETCVTADPGKLDFYIIREFDAPREFVFKAYTDPGLITQWLGPRRLTMTLKKFEPRSGGSYRYVFREADGAEHGFHGVVHEVKFPERIIQTFEFEGLPESGHVDLESTVFEELPDMRSRVTTHVVFLSVADRDGHLEAGMEEGVRESYERLDELLANMEQEE